MIASNLAQRAILHTRGRTKESDLSRRSIIMGAECRRVCYGTIRRFGEQKAPISNQDVDPSNSRLYPVGVLPDM